LRQDDAVFRRRRSRDLGTREVNLREIGSREVNLREIGSREVNLLDVGFRDVHINLREIGSRDVHINVPRKLSLILNEFKIVLWGGFVCIGIAHYSAHGFFFIFGIIMFSPFFAAAWG
jgi:hypothetical protein